MGMYIEDFATSRGLEEYCECNDNAQMKQGWNFQKTNPIPIPQGNQQGATTAQINAGPNMLLREIMIQERS
jgi:hypothetical protein